MGYTGLWSTLSKHHIECFFVLIPAGFSFLARPGFGSMSYLGVYPQACILPSPFWGASTSLIYPLSVQTIISFSLKPSSRMTLGWPITPMCDLRLKAPSLKGNLVLTCRAAGHKWAMGRMYWGPARGITPHLILSSQLVTAPSLNSAVCSLFRTGCRSVPSPG